MLKNRLAMECVRMAWNHIAIKARRTFLRKIAEDEVLAECNFEQLPACTRIILIDQWSAKI